MALNFKMSGTPPGTPTASGPPVRGPWPPVLALGFRPFFLLAGVMATLWIPMWLMALSGNGGVPRTLPPVDWHRHEMLFGYTLAVVAGFLLTAAQNWTGVPMPSGGKLLGLVVLWLAGRAVILGAETLPPGWVAGIDAGFPLAVALALLPGLWRRRNYRNLGFVPLVLLFALANLSVHLSWMGLSALSADVALDFTLNLVLLIMVVMGGRVIPSFTRNALPQAGVRLSPLLDKTALATVAALTVVEALPVDSAGVGVAALLAALANGARLSRWGGWATRGTPLLWVLHLAYGWVVLGLALKGAAAFLPGVPASAGAHAITVGGIGLLTLGMMSRVALGHTGRPLRVSSLIVVAYGLLNLAALVRVAVPWLSAGAQTGALHTSGMLWSLAFLLFTAVYAPILTRPRADGMPG